MNAEHLMFSITILFLLYFKKIVLPLARKLYVVHVDVSFSKCFFCTSKLLQLILYFPVVFLLYLLNEITGMHQCSTGEGIQELFYIVFNNFLLYEHMITV